MDCLDKIVGGCGLSFINIGDCGWRHAKFVGELHLREMNMLHDFSYAVFHNAAKFVVMSVMKGDASGGIRRRNVARCPAFCRGRWGSDVAVLQVLVIKPSDRCVPVLRSLHPGPPLFASRSSILRVPVLRSLHPGPPLFASRSSVLRVPVLHSSRPGLLLPVLWSSDFCARISVVHRRVVAYFFTIYQDLFFSGWVMAYTMTWFSDVGTKLKLKNETTKNVNIKSVKINFTGVEM